MRRSNLRFGFAAMLVGLCAWAVTLGERHLAAQPVPGKGKDKDKDKDKDNEKDVHRITDDWAFGPPLAKDPARQLEAARQYLEFKEVPWPTVCELLQRILDSKSDSFIEVPENGVVNSSYLVSVKTEANRIISSFPKAGLEFYQQAYGQDAAKLLKEAIEKDCDLSILSELSLRYYHTRAGAQGTILLGTVYLERGNYQEAAYSFERLLSRPDADEVLTPRTLYKAALALRRSDDPRHAAALKQVVSRLERAITRDGGLMIGRRTFTLEQVRAELEAPVVALRPVASLNEWAMRYGNPARNAVVVGGAPFLDPLYAPIPMLDQARSTPAGADPSDADGLIRAELERVYGEKRRGVPLPAFFPVTTSDTIVFRSYDGIHAYATRDRPYAGRLVRAGQPLWSQPSDFGTYQLLTTSGLHFREPEVKTRATQWWETYRNMNASGILFENPLLGALAHDGRYVYFLDDISIPPPPAYNDPNSGVMPPQQPQYGNLSKAITAGQLVAVDMQTGMQGWYLGRPPITTFDPKNPAPAPLNPLNEDEADQATDAYRLCLHAVFLGPPLPLNGRLYVLIEHGNIVRLLCLDPHKLVRPAPFPSPAVPALLWSQKLGRPTNDVTKDPIRRYQGAFLAAGEGILVCPTNSGAVIGVDVLSRSLLWAHAYRKSEPGEKKLPGQVVPLPQIPEGRWRAGAPIITGGRVVLAAYDSNKLECLDLRTGKVIWEVPRGPNDLYVGAVVNEKVIVVSRNQVRAYHLNKLDPNSPASGPPEPLLAWTGSDALPTPTGHGVAGKGVYFIPVRQENAGQDTIPAAEIWAVNIETGQIVSKTMARSQNNSQELARYGLGNLVYQDGMVFSQSAWEVAAYPQLEVKRAEMDALLKDNPNDPAGLADRGMLQLDDGKLTEAIADFKAAQANNPPERLARQIRDKLYIAYTELLKADFAGGERYLKEYEALCEVAAEADTDAAKKKAEEESTRRRRIYLYLLAKGREKQGRLVDAFDHYLALATLGGDRLQPDPDDPSVKVRPDVWARGRIEGMVRRTSDPEARKALEARVHQEWDAVKDGQDLNRLRHFVTVFGPYFAVGADAELKLAESLLSTNNEVDAREAQTLLAHLRATAEAPLLRAKATEALARLMIRNGLMEDAVALYLQLGKDYPDFVVRDGKTGSDFLTELLTDKRLLPYLEPSRYPLPTRVKADQMGGGGDPRGQMGAVFEIEPQGELLPVYQRLRFVLDLTGTGGPGWTIRAIDRVTGREMAKFPELNPPPINQPGAIPFSKFFHAGGHLLTFQLGTWVYCLDLAEKKERWRKNLLTDPPPGVAPNPQIQVTASGEIVVQFSDGTLFPIMDRVVLHAGYCALVTQDGLEVFDPLNKDKHLWSRRGLPERVHVYGDARHILIVELGADRKPVNTRLLRAVDGMAVEGAPDSARVLGAARSYRAFGRTVLLYEGSGDSPRVVRLNDLSSGKDVWRKEYDAKALFLNPLNPDWAGAVKPDGTVEVLHTHTGQPVATLQLGKGYFLSDPIGPAIDAQLFADRDRFYVVLDREINGGAGVRNLQRIYSFSLRTQRVNGPMFCFDRVSGKKLWYVELLLDDQSDLGDPQQLAGPQLLILDQFHDLPVIVAAAPMLDPRTRGVSYKVVVIEKERGRVVFNRAIQNDGNVFQSITVDPRAGTIDFNRFNVRIHIRPDDDVKRP